MNVLIRDLSEKMVGELKKQASENNRSLQAELKAVVVDMIERRRHLRDWNKNVDRIFKELAKSGQKFPDSTELIRKDRNR
jgi:hypothetical protein